MSKFNLDGAFVIDIETRGLLDKLKSKEDLHVMSVGCKVEGKWNIKSTNREEDVYIGDYFEKKREEIMKLIESVKYYNPFQKYVITEEDFEEAIKSLLNLINFAQKN